MFFSKIDPMSIVDGDGCRVTLFVSGCRNHCPGCFNEATWDFEFGTEFTDIENMEILAAADHKYIAGLTILGGEPFEPENQPTVLSIMDSFKQRFPDKTIWLYTGYVLDRDLVSGGRRYIDGITDRILDSADVLVDGPFVLAERDLTLKFRGSRNQRVLSRNDIAELRGNK